MVMPSWVSASRINWNRSYCWRVIGRGLRLASVFIWRCGRRDRVTDPARQHRHGRTQRRHPLGRIGGVAGRHLDPLAPARDKAVARPREQCPTRIQRRVAAVIHIETNHIERYLPSRCRIMRNGCPHHPIGAESAREIVHDGALYEVGGRIAPYFELMDRDAASAVARDHLRAVEIAGDRGLIHPNQRPAARLHGGGRRIRNPWREIEHLCRRRSASREQQRRRRGCEPMPPHRRLSDLPVISALGLRSRYSAISRSERAAPSICCTRPRISASSGDRSPTCRSIVASVCPVWSISRFVVRTVSFKLAISTSERAPRRSTTLRRSAEAPRSSSSAPRSSGPVTSWFSAAIDS